ncbi:MAG: type II toxin-antitoxin system RelB/DinJ family antitoxin [Firmicutes bacterium]|nr:type II toxin-antitoxin system RelB/DinJ family antitoxin [[Eubacterium] siraeum]MCM1487299.1 type II toxin-antitoxin system RelB/DinJ family antitoxin [Bacillota bacterium]
MATSNINVRVDANLKKEAEILLEELGLNLSSAINIYLRKMVQTQSIPFTIGKYNAETQAAMRETDEIISGKQRTRSYSSARELFAELDREIEEEDSANT